jgi:hypothetical protein
LSQKVVRLKDRTLLINSQVIEDYPWLKKLLKENEIISNDDIALLPLEQQNFFQNMLATVIKQAVGEWKADDVYPTEDLGSDKTNWIRCALCHQPNRYIFYISNKLNSNSLNVGSECVKEFGIDLGHKGMSADKLIKEAKKLKRMSDINLQFPGISRLINSWSNKLEEQPIIIPTRFESPYFEIGSKIKMLYEGYVERKLDEGIFEDIKRLLDESNELINAIEQYVKENISKKFVPSKNISDWLRRRGDFETIKMLKKNGRITWGTAHRIGEPQFVNSIIPDFNQSLKNINIRIEGADLDKEGYIITYLDFARIRFFCKHKDFVLDFGGLLFGEELIVPFKAETVIAKSRVLEETSKELIVDRIKEITRGAEAHIRNYDSKFDEITIYEDLSSKYLVASMTAIVEEFKELALGLGDKTVEDFVAYINKLSVKRYTLKEIEDIEKLRREL